MMKRIRIEARPFPAIHALKDLPDRTMEEHERLYQTYVRKTNEIFAHLEVVDRETAHPIFSEYRSLKTDLMTTLGAVKSYEIFFAHLGGTGGHPSGALAEMIQRDFGSFAAWIADFRASAMASRGWVALAYDLDLGRLVNVLGDTPEQMSVWNLQPVLVFEVSDRTASIDFHRDRTRYLNALFANLDWAAVGRNLDDALALGATRLEV